MAIVTRAELDAYFPDGPPKNITAQKMRDFVETIQQLTGGYQCFPVTMFLPAGWTPSDGNYQSGTNCYDAIEEARIAAGKNGAVLFPALPKNNFYRTTGNHQFNTQLVAGVGGMMGLIQFDPDNNASDQYCFRMIAGRSPDDKEYPFKAAFRDLHIMGNTTRRNINISSPTGSMLGWDTITGASSGHTAHNLYPETTSTTISVTANRSDSGAARFTVGETLNATNGSWSATYTGTSGDWGGRPNNTADPNAYGPPRGSLFWIGSGDHIIVDNCQASYSNIGFRYEPSFNTGWMENISSYNCKAEQVYDSGFVISTPAHTGWSSVFMNEFLFMNCETRTSWGHGLRYVQANNSGGDGKISGHTWIQTEMDCRKTGWGARYDENCLFEVNERKYNGVSDGVYGEIEEILFIRPTIEQSGWPPDPRAFVFRFKNDQAGNSSNIGPISVRNGIYFDFDGNSNAATITDAPSDTKYSNFSPIISSESADGCKRFDLEFLANGGGDRDHLVKGGQVLVCDSGTSFPVPPYSGMLFFNTSSNTFYVYNGSAWRSIATSA